ncbi:MAG: glycogen synthase GlgA, partial [Planctomycetales bacterium]
MRIVLASSEAVPFSKTGGLADVASALTRALSRAGHEVTLVTPHYPQVRARSAPDATLKPTKKAVQIAVGDQMLRGTFLRAELPGCDARVLLLDRPEAFDRPELYGERGRDYIDNCERFVFFSRAVLEAIHLFDLNPDVLHAHDWQTGLVPAYLELEHRRLGHWPRVASVFTIHNLAFQGQFWHWDMPLTGLDWVHFHPDEMEFWGKMNFLKTGVVFADRITTVSPTYAEEIQTEEFGCGLDGVLAERREKLVGILNGVDTDEWNPATDPHIVKNYAAETLVAGKAACKADLQQRLGLPAREDVPLFGMISRMADQKGFDLIVEAADDLLARDLQLCFLGTGMPEYEEAARQLAQEHPEKVATVIGFDDALAHRIEAGADAFLMPSRYEPCGLNQMYSLLYGTVPVVHAVGGLADSVVQTTAETLANGTATGFRFDSYDARSFRDAVQDALRTFADRET